MSNTECYYPNGNLVTQEQVIPCGSGSGASCCPLNWTCQTDGLCYLANQQYYGRYSCTDKSWQSSGCPHICTYNDTADGDEAILECEPGSYCCDTNRPELSGGQNCCDASSKRFSIEANSSVDGSMQTPTTPTTAAQTSTIAAPAAPSSTSCGNGLGETPCGTICCAMGQYCALAGQCSAISATLASSSGMATSLSTSSAAAITTSSSLPSATFAIPSPTYTSTAVASTSTISSPTHLTLSTSPAIISSAPSTSNSISVTVPNTTNTTLATPTTSPPTSIQQTTGFKAGLPAGAAVLLFTLLAALLYRRRRQGPEPGNNYGSIPPGHEASGNITPPVAPDPHVPPQDHPYERDFPLHPLPPRNGVRPANRSRLNQELIPDQYQNLHDYQSSQTSCGTHQRSTRMMGRLRRRPLCCTRTSSGGTPLLRLRRRVIGARRRRVSQEGGGDGVGFGGWRRCGGVDGGMGGAWGL